MGIILRHVETDTYIFYLKGAEVVMQNMVRPGQRDCILEHCENLAREGLRTLVITQKLIRKEDFVSWMARYNEAKADLTNRKEAVARVVSELEKDMELLGVTGVEDKLQDNVASTVESLRSAGIQIWMLTGDKVETATCIAISAGFKSRNQQFFFMKELTSTNEADRDLGAFELKQNAILMIDGQTLDICMSNKKLEEKFFTVAT